MAMLGIDNSDIQQNKAAYIHGWLEAFKEDKRLVVKAASQAQKVVDYILDMNFYDK